jgi:hypothetical protein
MKVKELIEWLEMQDPEDVIVFWDDDNVRWVELEEPFDYGINVKSKTTSSIH